MKMCKKVCKECPFSDSALRGWLGPHSPEEILDSMQFESYFTCHMRRTEDSSFQDIEDGNLPICRGFVISASKSFKLFGSTDQGKKLRCLQDEIEKSEHKGILDRRSFLRYHTVSFSERSSQHVRKRK